MKKKITLIICSFMLMFSFNVSLQAETPGVDLVRVMVLLDEQPQGINENNNYYEQQQAMVKRKMSEITKVTYRRKFSQLINGFSAMIPRKAIEQVSKIKGVASVRPSVTYYPMMQDAVKLTQALQTAQTYDVRGEGLVVSIIDTGIDPAHQDMRLTDVSKAKIKTVAQTDGTPLTTKVPYGYNFADENYIVKDAPGKSMHGMHVAGIVAANGGKDADIVKNGRVNGVAPEAQLLAMKVFSNIDGIDGAQDDDIAAAIEDSVAKGADVINMSLGSANGFNTSSYGVQKAVANATKAGVLVVIAAGNDGLSHSKSLGVDNQLETQDSGAFASPSASPDALSIASMENSTIAVDKAVVKQAETAENFAYALATGTPDGQEHELVSVGLGKEEDYQDKNVTGKFVLVQRGEITFKTKYDNAIKNGATGVVVYNNAEDPEEAFGMAGLDGVETFGVALVKKVGEQLLGQVKKGTTTVRFTTEKMLQENPQGGKPSSFTSWGPTPDLEFKPELSAPGGNIYSTVQDNKYQVDSGTSMATPHVAGASALAIQKISAALPTLDRVQRLQFIKHSFMNTAKLMEEDGVPYSLRRQGAGTLQLADAIKNRVIATVAGQSSVALHEVENGQTFEVTLQNYSDEQQTFTIQPQKVMTEVIEDTVVKTQFVEGASVSANQNEVVLAPNATAKVTFTVNTGTIQDAYIEGIVKFVSKKAEQPNISLPYLGFVGDWGKEQIVATPIYETGGKTYAEVDTTNTAKTELLSDTLEFTTLAEAVVSPNGDGLNDIVYPKVALLRNAKEVTFDIVNALNHEEVIKNLWLEDNMSRPVLGKLNAGKETVSPTKSAKFDGTVYNAHTGTVEVLPDGKYVYRIGARVNTTEEFQYTYMPFIIDTEKPVLSNLRTITDAEGNRKVVFTLTDKLSEIRGVIANSSKYEKLAVQPTGNANEYAVQVGQDDTFVYLAGFDQGLNAVEKYYPLTNEPFISVNNYTSYTGKVLSNNTVDQYGAALVDKGEITLTGIVNGDITKVKYENVEAKVENGEFTLALPLKEGKTSPTLIGLGVDGSEKTQLHLAELNYDVTAPTLTFTKPQDEKTPVEAENGTFTITGTVSDNLNPVQVVVNGNPVPLENNMFTYTLTEPKVNNVTFVATDGANQTVKTIQLKTTSVVEEEPLTIMVDGVNIQGLEKIVQDDPNYNAETKEYHLHGSFNRKPKAFYIGNELVTVNDDLTFEKKIVLTNDLTQINFRTVDNDDKIILNHGVRFYRDNSVPELQLDTPNIINDVVYTNQDELLISGQLTDEGFGYNLLINGNLVTRTLNYAFTTRDTHLRAFSHTIKKVKTGDKTQIIAEDFLGNKLEKNFSIVVDKVAPTIEITNVTDGEKMLEDKVLHVSSKDDQLLMVNSVTLNDTPITTPYDTSALQSGFYILKVYALDAAGNHSYQQVLFEKINKPVVVVPSTLEVDYGQTPTVENLKITATDKEDGDITAKVQIDPEQLVDVTK